MEKLKSSSEYVKSLKEINLRIDGIEKLLQLLLVNNLIDDAINYESSGFYTKRHAE